MNNPTVETVTLGGGCFWCLEAVYDMLKGVQSVESGYANGTVPNPTYKQVCTGATGYAEVVQVKYNPDEISFHDLLDVFFTIHDPTSLNRQGADVGTQYRSGIYYHTAAQRDEAQGYIKALNDAHTWPKPIVTEVQPVDHYYPAEDYHQEYFVNNTNQPYCRMVVAPKVSKARQHFIEKLRK